MSDEGGFEDGCGVLLSLRELGLKLSDAYFQFPGTPIQSLTIRAFMFLRLRHDGENLTHRLKTTKISLKPVNAYRFHFNAELGVILVPVTFSGRSVMFVLDTGCSNTIFDIAHRKRLGSRSNRQQSSPPTAAVRASTSTRRLVGRLAQWRSVGSPPSPASIFPALAINVGLMLTGCHQTLSPPGQNQERVLLALQEQDWLGETDDPLAPSGETLPSKRLSDTIAALNSHHENAGIIALSLAAASASVGCAAWPTIQRLLGAKRAAEARAFDIPRKSANNGFASASHKSG